jgi:hypothetical protein
MPRPSPRLSASSLLAFFVWTLAACDAGSSRSTADASPTDDAAASDATKHDAGSLPDAPSAPTSCETPKDCASPADQICDPSSGVCAEPQCGTSSGKSCDANHVCVYQMSGVTIGACYPRCTPFATAPSAGSCAQGQECVIGSFDGVTGYCKPTGTLAAGAPCTGSSTSTTCVPGYVCIPDPSQHFCREQCDFWGAAHDCSDAKLCTPPGVCTGDVIDPAALDAPCATSSAAGTLCGAVGPRALGWCIGSPGKTVCSKWCRMQQASDCPASEACKPTNVPSIGYCQ